MTDHELIVTVLQLNPLRETPTLGRNWAKADWKQMIDDAHTDLATIGLAGDDSFPICTRTEIEDSIGCLVEAIQRLIQVHVPTKRVCSKSRSWYDNEVRMAHQRMKEAKRTWRRSPTDAHKLARDTAIHDFRSTARHKKQKAFRNFCSSLGNENMWNGIQRLTGQKRAHHIDYLQTPDGTLTEPCEMAAALANKYFVKEATPRPDSFKSSCAHRHQHWRASLPPLEDEITEFTTAEIREELKRGKLLSAPGPDGIPNLILRRLHPALENPLRRIFNACLSLGHFPAAFRTSRVISIPKPGKDPTSTAGHRPIALLSCMSKKLEALLRGRLAQHMEESNRWSEHQYGFRRRRSTTHALDRLFDKASQALNHRNQQLAISFDLQAAYDSTDPDIMWNTLYEAELPRPLLRLLDGFYRNRKAGLLLGDTKWTYSPRRGLPQGSPLSPALFITYANSLLDTLSGHVEGQLYADDLIIWKELQADGTDASDLQLTLRKLEDWARTHEMRFNEEKTL